MDPYIFVLSFSLWLRSVLVSELHFRVLGFCDAGLIGSNRPVLKHGPRSLTRARVRGSHESRRGAMKVKAALAGGRGGIPRPLPVRRGRTTGPSRPPRRGGGA